jgi:hypothetical protein
MRGADESRSAVVPYGLAVMRATAVRVSIVCLCLGGGLAAMLRGAHPAAASSVTIGSTAFEGRTTIPVTINGQRTSCVLDTGTSAILVSPAVAQDARLPVRAGTFEVAPDGHTYVDRQTQIARFGVAGHSLQDVPALISSNLQGQSALCGYDFFTHFPTLIDRDRRLVTLFPPASRLARMRCTPVDLSPHVPLASVEINDTWVSHVVLDSGMAGGGALWDGVRTQLRRPLVADESYVTMPAGIREGFACGALASIRFAPGTPTSDMPICTEPQRPDGYNGIIETNLPAVHAMAVDYAHRRVCFDVGGDSASGAPELGRALPNNAWARFNYLRPPNH